MVKYLIILPVIGFLLFVVWMNATPGYFHYEHCGCDVSYYQDKPSDINGTICPAILCVEQVKTVSDVLIALSYLDFNK